MISTPNRSSGPHSHEGGERLDADHDEAMYSANTDFMAANIPQAGLLLQLQVSHFSFLQEPEQMNADLLHFMHHVRGR